MGKPWGRYEIGYVDHRKFLALTGNAFALWWEGKNYCDAYHTDGIFPCDVLRRFRFNGVKSVDLLTQSCGPKPNGHPFAPLWERLDIGGVPHFRMHDYLDHNDCRDEVLERLQDADDRGELRRLKNTERMREARQQRKVELEVARAQSVRARAQPVRTQTAHCAQNTSRPTEAETQTQKEQESSEASSEPPILVFPVVGHGPTVWGLLASQVAEWQALYPGLDVLAECRKALAWAVANPRKRKTASGMPKFLVSWLTRATDRGRPSEPSNLGVVAALVNGCFHEPPCVNATAHTQRCLAERDGEGA